MGLKIEQKHIDNGVQESSDKCALALAINEHTKFTPSIGYLNIHLYTEYSNDPLITLNTPDEMIDFIDLFDQDKDFVHPMEFDINLPVYVELEEITQDQ